MNDLEHDLQHDLQHDSLHGTPKGTPAHPLKQLRQKLASLTTAAASILEQNPWLAILLILLVYLPITFETSRNRLLWHDELFTYWIAQAPTLTLLWHDLRTLDLNPPLVYLLTRLSFHLFGVNTLATRLPEILGFLIALLAIFRFVRLRLGVTFALFAVLLLMRSDLATLSSEARPYALMLAFLGVALVAWQEAIVPPGTSPGWRRHAAVVLLFAAVLGMLFSHIFSVFAVASLLFAELVRTRIDRKPDLPIAAALLLPLFAVLTYLPMLRNHAAAIYPLAFQPGRNTIAVFYTSSINQPLFSLCLTALAVLLLFGVEHLRSDAPSENPRWFFSQPEWAVLAGLFTAPLILIVRLRLTHGAFFTRYGAIATFAVAILATALLARWTMHKGRPNPAAALLGILIVLSTSGLASSVRHQITHHTLIPTIANSEPPHKPCEACRNVAAIDPTLPLVDASGLTFVEMNHRESPATLDHIFYLTDPAASAEFAHANIFEHMAQVAQSFHFAGHVQPYPDFIAQHPHFFVLGTYEYPEDWLLRKLHADHADLRVLDPVDDYLNREVYEVTVAPDHH